MEGFTIERQQVDGRPEAWRLRLRGTLDIETAAACDAAIEAVVDLGGRAVELQLGDVTFLDSTGLRSIVRGSRLLADHDGRLTCSGLSGAAGRVLEVTGLLEELREPPATGTA